MTACFMAPAYGSAVADLQRERVDAHLGAGRDVRTGGGAAADLVRVGAADRDVEDDEEAVVDGGLPGRVRHLVLLDREGLGAVEGEAQFLGGGVAAVHDDGVGVIAALAAGAVLEIAGDAVRVVALALPLSTVE